MQALSAQAFNISALNCTHCHTLHICTVM